MKYYHLWVLCKTVPRHPVPEIFKEMVLEYQDTLYQRFPLKTFCISVNVLIFLNHKKICFSLALQLKDLETFSVQNSSKLSNQIPGHWPLITGYTSKFKREKCTQQQNPKLSMKREKSWTFDGEQKKVIKLKQLKQWSTEHCQTNNITTT